MITRLLPFDDDALAQAVTLIRAGQPVAVPTETVYGLAADATDAEAVARIYEAKGRPSFNPLIVHVPDLEAAAGIAELPPIALTLAAHFWPGPLTIVAPLQPEAGIASLVTAGLPTIALRVPAHPIMQALLKASGRPLAGPSANASGSISATRAEHVLHTLGGRIPLVIDGGATSVGLESTILAVADGRLRLLRPGPIDAKMIEEATGIAVEANNASSIEAPGQLASHYAPDHPLRLNVTAPATDQWLIGFGAIAGDRSLSPRGDMVEAAAGLFDALHEADRSGRAHLAVAPIPDEGLGLAINDRLRRAAAPR